MATEQEIKPVKRSIEEYYLEALNKIKKNPEAMRLVVRDLARSLEAYEVYNHDH